ncbi:DUF3108 domain-containing protein [bacterium]|nr:MAG: DUF3108 domain-containing protein [bacterium]
MKKIIFFLIVVFFSQNTILFGQNFKGKDLNINIEQPLKELSIGETLQYSVEWLGLPVGKIVLKVEDLKEAGGRQYYHISARTFPNRFFIKFYDVEYRWNTYVRRENLEPYRFVKIRRINNNILEVIVDFDQKNHRATYRHFAPHGKAEVIAFPSMRKEIVNSCKTIVPLPEDTHDLVSSLYYFRLMDIRENKDYSINVFYGQAGWNTDLKISKPYLKDFYKKGSFKIFEVSPRSDLTNLILGRRELTLYFTTDSRRIPIMITFNTAIGQFRAVAENLP